jgi:hypothetical protein
VLLAAEKIEERAADLGGSHGIGRVKAEARRLKKKGAPRRALLLGAVTGRASGPLQTPVHSQEQS